VRALQSLRSESKFERSINNPFRSPFVLAVCFITLSSVMCVFFFYVLSTGFTYIRYIYTCVGSFGQPPHRCSRQITRNHISAGIYIFFFRSYISFFILHLRVKPTAATHIIVRRATNVSNHRLRDQGYTNCNTYYARI